MMADLMDQHMRDDSAQGLFVVAPVVEDRPAVQPDHVWRVQRRAFGAEREAAPLEQPIKTDCQYPYRRGLRRRTIWVGCKIGELFPEAALNQIDDIPD